MTLKTARKETQTLQSDSETGDSSLRGGQEAEEQHQQVSPGPSPAAGQNDGKLKPCQTE